jgi:GntR family transcriptional regulator
MRLTLDDADVRPLYQQIASAIRGAVARGELQPQARLPSGRDLAESSGVTLETVQRAYKTLVDEGVLVSRVGRGTSVAQKVDVDALSVHAEARTLVDRARQLGLTLDQVHTAVADEWAAVG